MAVIGAERRQGSQDWEDPHGSPLQCLQFACTLGTDIYGTDYCSSTDVPQARRYFVDMPEARNRDVRESRRSGLMRTAIPVSQKALLFCVPGFSPARIPKLIP